MTAQVWLNPLASLSHGEVMIDYVINDCPHFIRASYMNATQGALYFYYGFFLVLVLVLVLAEVHTGPHWWQGENVHCRTDLTFLLYLETCNFDFLQYPIYCGKMTAINIFVSESLLLCTQLNKCKINGVDGSLFRISFTVFSNTKTELQYFMYTNYQISNTFRQYIVKSAQYKTQIVVCCQW